MLDSKSSLDVIVVGAGQAGLAVSRCLQRARLSHAVLEKESVGASWRHLWDGFHLNTPNQVNLLPDAKVPGDEDGFLSRDQWVDAMVAYSREHQLPIHTGVEVKSIRKTCTGYEVTTQDGMLQTSNVVLCTGDRNIPQTPKVAAQLSKDIQQLHSAEYRCAAQLPKGAVLVVGSGQTGGQIVEDLRESGRTVWLCTSKVGSAPRRYRGRDLFTWMHAAGLPEQRTTDIPPEDRGGRQPLISGAHGGHSVTLHSLGRAGARLLGRLQSIEGGRLKIADNLMANVAQGEVVAGKLRNLVDAFVEKAGLDAPPAQPDPADTPCERLEAMAAIREVELDKEQIRSVIWATGFGPSFSYLPKDFLNEQGLPQHEGGVIAPGLYCVGLVWLRRRCSGLIAGVAADAEFVVEQIQRNRPPTESVAP
jgi:putative flavoprotein involved in K+ transport